MALWDRARIFSTVLGLNPIGTGHRIEYEIQIRLDAADPRRDHRRDLFRGVFAERTPTNFLPI